MAAGGDPAPALLLEKSTVGLTTRWSLPWPGLLDYEHVESHDLDQSVCGQGEGGLRDQHSELVQEGCLGSYQV